MKQIFFCFFIVFSSFCPDLSNQEWIPSELDGNIIDNPIFSSNYADAQAWKAKSHLHRRLQKHPQWLNSNLGFDGFMNQNEGLAIDGLNNLGHELNAVYTLSDALRFSEQFKIAQKTLISAEFAAVDQVVDFIDDNNNKPFYNLATAEQMMRAANTIDASQQLALDNIQQSKQQILQELTALESNQPAYSESLEPPVEMDADYAAVKENLLAQLKSLSEERQILTGAIKDERIAELNGVKTFITNIAVEKEYEKSLKKLFLAVTKFNTEEITAIQYQAELEQILALSIEEAGVAYRYISGRGLNICNESTSSESLQSIGLISENLAVVAENLLVYPNPAKSELQITFPTSFTGNLLLMDLTGKIVWQKNGLVENHAFDLSLGGLSNGIYVLSAIDTENTISYQQKVIVQK